MSIEDLEAFFASAVLPEKIKLGQAVYIDDVARFVESHLTVIKHYPNNKGFQSFYDRLINLKELLERKSES